MSTVAEVLHEHRLGGTIGYNVFCACDREVGFSPDVYYRHVEEALANAGYVAAPEIVLDLEAVIADKERRAGVCLEQIAEFATKLPAHCDTASTRLAMLTQLRTDADETLKLIHEINGLRHGINQVAP